MYKTVLIIFGVVMSMTSLGNILRIVEGRREASELFVVILLTSVIAFFCFRKASRIRPAPKGNDILDHPDNPL